SAAHVSTALSSAAVSFCAAGDASYFALYASARSANAGLFLGSICTAFDVTAITESGDALAARNALPRQTREIVDCGYASTAARAAVIASCGDPPRRAFSHFCSSANCLRASCTSLDSLSTRSPSLLPSRSGSGCTMVLSLVSTMRVSSLYVWAFLVTVPSMYWSARNCVASNLDVIGSGVLSQLNPDALRLSQTLFCGITNRFLIGMSEDSLSMTCPLTLGPSPTSFPRNGATIMRGVPSGIGTRRVTCAAADIGAQANATAANPHTAALAL